ncbi:MAG: sugar phosphate nucleotidyltransferase [Oscillospiraceae bacterium]
MKAVILAGGEGTRLRPLSLSRPKALLPLFDGTVLSRCLENLRRAGVHDVILSLGHQAEQIEAWCGENTPEGMILRLRREEEPMGTAGAVRALLDELGEEDFLVLPGDAVFDFDLKELMAYHQTGRGAVTLALKRWEGVPECGMVVTDAAGRVERFVEKPGWDQVLSSTVNTGVYIMTRKAANLIPAQARWDFARDLFPVLLEQGVVISSHVMEGFWRDVGSPERYLDCMAQLLSGKGADEPPAPKIAPGIWSKVPIPDKVQVVPPCWFDAGVELGEGSLIGPHVALGKGVRIGRRALVQRSVLMEDARADDKATLYGAILGCGAQAGEGSVLNEGSVLADRARAGEGAVLSERVAVWPGREVPAGARLRRSLSTQREAEPLRFGDGGVLRGAVGEALSPELFTSLGVVLGGEGKVALGWSGGDGAAMLSRALGAGICAGGGVVLAHDGCCPAAAAWLGEYYNLSASLFVEQEKDRIFLHWFDQRGLPPERERLARAEQQWNAGAGTRVGAGQVGAWEHLAGVNTAYAADAERRVGAASVTVAVPGESLWDQTLVNLLERMGCRALRHEAAGAPSFSAAHGGFRLEGRQEDGTSVDSGRLLALIALLELEKGNTVAVPASAPAVIDELGAQTGGKVLRLGRDKGAEEVYARSPWLRDALFAAGYLAAALGRKGQTLAELLERLPPFTISSAEIPLQGGRGALMEAFTGRFRCSEPAGTGVRLRSGGGWVYVHPLIRRRAVFLQTEGADAEIARELCGFYEKEIRQLDTGGNAEC